VILTALTIFHVVLSLVAIGAGFVVAYGLLTSKLSSSVTKLFLITMAATSITGFFFPFHGFTPGQAVGILSLIVLLFAFLAIYRYHLAGGWRRTFTISAVLALYLNVFVLIVQLFRKVPALMALAPTQSEPPFQVTQLAALLICVAIGIRAATKNSQRAIRAE
jgi:hypothetical protein